MTKRNKIWLARCTIPPHFNESGILTFANLLLVVAQSSQAYERRSLFRKRCTLYEITVHMFKKRNRARTQLNELVTRCPPLPLASLKEQCLTFPCMSLDGTRIPCNYAELHGAASEALHHSFLHSRNEHNTSPVHEIENEYLDMR